MQKIVVCGLGKVGKGLALFLKSLGHEVFGLDVNPDAAAALEREMNTTTSPAVACGGAEAAVLIVPTPQEGDRLSSAHVVRAGEEARQHLPPSATLLIASTLDPRDALSVCEHLRAIYTPVMIRLGTVLQDLQTQPYLLIGSHRVELPEYHAALALWSPGWQRWTESQILHADPTTIACAKLAINASLSSRIAWANDVAMRARAFGADAQAVLQAVGMDPRIGPAFLQEGWPPAGPCLVRDLGVWSSVPGDGMAEGIVVAHRIVRQRMLRDVMDRLAARPVETVAVIGLTYKPNGLDYTDAFGVEAVKVCAKAGYKVYAYDREGSSEALIAGLGGQRVEATAPFSAFDAIVVGFPGYPEELAREAERKSRGLLVVNPWEGWR